MARTRTRTRAQSNAAEARRENRRKLRMIADWSANGVQTASVPSGLATTPTGVQGAGPTAPSSLADIPARYKFSKADTKAWAQALLSGDVSTLKALADKYKVPNEAGSIPIIGGVVSAAGDVRDFLGNVPQYLKIAAGGLGLIITGLALVYVAGRNTPITKAASAVATATPVGRVRKAASSVATGRKALVRERRDRKFYQTAYENTGEAREGARAARRTKVLPRHEGVVKGSGKAYRK